MPMKNEVLRLPGLVVRVADLTYAKLDRDGNVIVRSTKLRAVVPATDAAHADRILSEIYSVMSGDAAEPEPDDPKTVREGRPESLYLGPNEFIFVPAPPRSAEPERANAALRTSLIHHYQEATPNGFKCPCRHVVRARLLNELRRDPTLRILYVSANSRPSDILGEFMRDMRINGVDFHGSYLPPKVTIVGGKAGDPTLRVIPPYASTLGFRADIVVFDGTAAVAAIDPIVARAVRQEIVLTRLAPGGVVLDIPSPRPPLLTSRR